MRTITFQSVVTAAARRSGLNPFTWQDETRQNLLAALNAWVLRGWEWEFWPEWTVLEQRAYRDTYDPAKAYPAPTASVPVEVWFPASQRYYQALQANTGQAPATYDPVSGSWIANAPYWADSVAGYSYGVPFGQVVPAPYFGSDWVPNMAYTAGPAEVHRNPGDNRFYQCITSHTSGTTFDPTKWGILTVFERYVSLDQTGMTPIGEVRQLTKHNPRVSPRYPGPLDFKIDVRGIIPAPMAGVQVYVEFRLRPPQFTLDEWVKETIFDKDCLCYQQDTTGECYRSLVDNNVGNLPETSPAEWVKVDFPYILEDFVKFGIYADLMRADGNMQKADDAEKTAFEKLSQASDTALASQGQYDRAGAQVY